MQNSSDNGHHQTALAEPTLDDSPTRTHRTAQRTIPTTPTSWVTYTSEVNPELKRALAHHVAYHLIDYGNMLLIGSGTTLNSLMDEIIGRHIQEQKAFDLLILTSNLQVMAKGRDAQLGRIGVKREPAASNLFSEMQTILTGGTLRSSLDSLTGQYAAEGVNNEQFYPNWVFFGVAGLSFSDKQLTIRYHFQDEIATQEAYATRPTEHRVILCDHTKLGAKSGLKADLTIDSLIESAERCTIITTVPEKSSPEYPRVQTEVKAFKELLSGVKPEYAARVSLRLVEIDGDGIQDITVRSAVASHGSLAPSRRERRTNKSPEPSVPVKS